jgi:hypothetical protein
LIKSAVTTLKEHLEALSGHEFSTPIETVTCPIDSPVALFVTRAFAMRVRIAATHAPSPNLIGANESRSPVGGERLFQQPARAGKLAAHVL